MRERLGKLAIEIWVEGQAPPGATRYELEGLRCDTCSEVFTATLPAEPGSDIVKQCVSLFSASPC